MRTIAFVDTETTGFAAEDVCWQVGIVTCQVEDGRRGDVVVSRRESEYVLPRLPSDWPSKAFQKRRIMDACRVDCDIATDYARDAMRGTCDRDGFSDHMRDFLEQVREERVTEIEMELERASTVLAWNAKFDDRILRNVCPYGTFTVRCAMQQFRGLNAGVPSSLASAADYYRIRVDGVRHHTALHDAELLEKVWFRMNSVRADDALSRIRAAFGR